MEQNIIAVSQVNEYIKFLLDRDELLANLCVRGIGNLHHDLHSAI